MRRRLRAAILTGVRDELLRLTRRVSRRAGVDLERFPSFLTRRGLLARVLREMGVDEIVDVGANRGQFGMLVRDLGYAGPITSFEPVPYAYEALRAVAERSPPWRTAQTALGSTRETRALNVAEATEVSSFLTPNAGYRDMFSGSRTRETLDVQIERLDDVFTPRPRSRVLLKTDAQGFDLEVLAGAEHALAAAVALHIELSVRPIYEGSPNWLDVIAAVEDHGFVLSGLYPVDVNPNLHLVELDGVFVRWPT